MVLVQIAHRLANTPTKIIGVFISCGRIPLLKIHKLKLDSWGLLFLLKLGLRAIPRSCRSLVGDVVFQWDC